MAASSMSQRIISETQHFEVCGGELVVREGCTYLPDKLKEVVEHLHGAGLQKTGPEMLSPLARCVQLYGCVDKGLSQAVLRKIYATFATEGEVEVLLGTDWELHRLQEMVAVLKKSGLVVEKEMVQALGFMEYDPELLVHAAPMLQEAATWSEKVHLLHALSTISTENRSVVFPLLIPLLQGVKTSQKIYLLSLCKNCDLQRCLTKVGRLIGEAKTFEQKVIVFRHAVGEERVAQYGPSELLEDASRFVGEDYELFLSYLEPFMEGVEREREPAHALSLLCFHLKIFKLFIKAIPVALYESLFPQLIEKIHAATPAARSQFYKQFEQEGLDRLLSFVGWDRSLIRPPSTFLEKQYKSLNLGNIRNVNNFLESYRWNESVEGKLLECFACYVEDRHVLKTLFERYLQQHRVHVTDKEVEVLLQTGRGFADLKRVLGLIRRCRLMVEISLVEALLLSETKDLEASLSASNPFLWGTEWSEKLLIVQLVQKIVARGDGHIFPFLTPWMMGLSGAEKIKMLIRLDGNPIRWDKVLKRRVPPSFAERINLINTACFELREEEQQQTVLTKWHLPHDASTLMAASSFSPDTLEKVLPFAAPLLKETEIWSEKAIVLLAVHDYISNGRDSFFSCFKPCMEGYTIFQKLIFMLTLSKSNPAEYDTVLKLYQESLKGGEEFELKNVLLEKAIGAAKRIDVPKEVWSGILQSRELTPLFPMEELIEAPKDLRQQLEEACRKYLPGVNHFEVSNGKLVVEKGKPTLHHLQKISEYLLDFDWSRYEVGEWNDGQALRTLACPVAAYYGLKREASTLQLLRTLFTLYLRHFQLEATPQEMDHLLSTPSGFARAKSLLTTLRKLHLPIEGELLKALRFTSGNGWKGVLADTFPLLNDAPLWSEKYLLLKAVQQIPPHLRGEIRSKVTATNTNEKLQLIRSIVN